MATFQKIDGAQANTASAMLTPALDQILTKKEIKVDFFLNCVADYISEEIREKQQENKTNHKKAKMSSSSSSSSNSNSCTQEPAAEEEEEVAAASEEKKQELLDLADNRLSELSILLNHKFGNILKQHIVQKEEANASKLFSHIQLPVRDVKKMSDMYKECYSAWVDSPYVTYAAHNKTLLGNLSEKDCLLLHLFAFLTCYRAKGDNLYAVSITGASTTGKTLLFENPILANGHQHVAEAGVGRWVVGKRSVLCYHDIPLDRLVKGSDGEKFKTICRTERSTCKIFGSTSVLPPLFVFITSNQNVQTHRQTTTATAALFKNFMSKETVVSKLDHLFTAKKQDLLKESVNAVKSRVIEAYVSRQPKIDPKNIPSNGNFTRLHAILGMFERIVGILEKYDSESFYSLAMWNYAIAGMVNNIAVYQKVIKGPEAAAMHFRLTTVVNKYVKDEASLIKFREKLCA